MALPDRKDSSVKGPWLLMLFWLTLDVSLTKASLISFTFGKVSSARRIGKDFEKNFNVWFLISSLEKKFSEIISLKNYRSHLQRIRFIENILLHWIPGNLTLIQIATNIVNRHCGFLAVCILAIWIHVNVRWWANFWRCSAGWFEKRIITIWRLIWINILLPFHWYSK